MRDTEQVQGRVVWSQDTRRPFSVHRYDRGIALRDVVELDLANAPTRQDEREAKTGVFQFTETGDWVEKLVCVEM